jgi:hypothetical protein
LGLDGHRAYTTRLLKGGALLSDLRLLLLEWDATPGAAERIVRDNVLSQASRKRAADIVNYVFVPRFVHSDPPDLWRSVAVLERAGWSQAALVPIHYFAAAAAEPLLADFVTEVLARRAAQGQTEVGTADVLDFLAKAPDERFFEQRWSGITSLKVARSLLAALRDFGVLSGAVKKKIHPIYLPTETFAFLTMLRHASGVRGAAMLHDPCWRLFYLGDTAVERFLIEAHQRKLLGYHAAGSLVRIEFPAADPEAYAHVLAEGAH